MIKRVYVEKKAGFNIEALDLLRDLRENLEMPQLTNLRVINRYDVEGLDEEEFNSACKVVFAEAQVDVVHPKETFPSQSGDVIFGIEYLPGQFDQRADSAAQCIQILTHRDKPIVKSARFFVLQGNLSDQAVRRIKNYCINKVDSREASLRKPHTLEQAVEEPQDVAILVGFREADEAALQTIMDDNGLAMSLDDLKFTQAHYQDNLARDPTLTEIKLLDTYWSDHCRHTTFLSRIETVGFSDDALIAPVKESYEGYLKSREFVYGEASTRDLCLMDIATMGMKSLRKVGKLDDLEVSEEINAASIVVPVDIDGKEEEWLVMFKNETHNHPTEIEPFGGAATCLGGAIRDPLSGRSYVYQAMRVTGCGDPRTPVKDTLPGKLPQRKITLEAARGYSSYGNQIGLATGQVTELYHPGYAAKRMEIGAVVAAAPRKMVYRGTPRPGDVILLAGGRTGRDGIGGATGSSKQHDSAALDNSAEVQKGDPPMERKLQRLFRIPEAARMIVRCNDFGAGGVSVAIGELAPSLHIYLDRVPRKYEGLNGTELAISESQERMAVVVRADDAASFKNYAKKENLECVEVAQVTDTGRLIVEWRGKKVVDLDREFLDSNGVKQSANIFVGKPDPVKNPFIREIDCSNFEAAWLENLSQLNHCSQKGLVERFDSTIGACTVNHPFGGRFRGTPVEAMVAKIPLIEGSTDTSTLMSFGYNPEIAKWSPYHGATFSVLEAAAKIVASGASHETIRLTLQEYFPKIRNIPERWGLPFSALLGALNAQLQLEIPAIGGKDSMSGSFNELDVPPALVAFAVAVSKAGLVLSPEFKQAGSRIVLVSVPLDGTYLPVWDKVKTQFKAVSALSQKGAILAAHSIRSGGVALALSKMAFGNQIGVELDSSIDKHSLFRADYGSILLEVRDEAGLGELECQFIGRTLKKAVIKYQSVEITLSKAMAAWEAPLESVFATKTPASEITLEVPLYPIRTKKKEVGIAKPRVFIPVFPGTNCEYDTARAFRKAGAEADTFVFLNQNSSQVEESLKEMVKRINNSQILMLPGGFSAGDEPEGSGKFIATVFRNPAVSEATMRLLKERGGLALGICNGFQALVKIGLLPYGEIREVTGDCPTLTFNAINRHVSCYVKTRVTSVLSPWMAKLDLGAIHEIPVSHGEGRFVACASQLENLAVSGQIATQYVDLDGNPSMDSHSNPNGSLVGIEGITSEDGRVLGKMGHSERVDEFVGKNIPGNKYQPLFEGGVSYFL